MIINFNDLQIPFHRLAVGTVLINPDDIRYLKSIGEDMEYYWVYGMDLGSNQAHSDAELLKDIGDGEGWKVLP
jgi:hypothetical protein